MKKLHLLCACKSKSRQTIVHNIRPDCESLCACALWWGRNESTSMTPVFHFVQKKSSIKKFNLSFWVRAAIVPLKQKISTGCSEFVVTNFYCALKFVVRFSRHEESYFHPKHTLSSARYEEKYGPIVRETQKNNWLVDSNQILLVASTDESSQHTQY